MNFLLSMKKARDARKRIPFFSGIDLAAVEESGKIIGVSGKEAIGFRLEGIDYLLSDESRIQGFFNELGKFLNYLPEGIVLSFLRQSRIGNTELLRAYDSSIPKEDLLTNRIVEMKIKGLSKQRLLERRLFLFAIYLPQEKKKKLFSIARNYAQTNKEHSRFLANTEDLIRQVFGGLGLKVSRLTKEQILNEYYQKLNPSLSQINSYHEILNSETTWPRFETLRSKVLIHPPHVYEDSLYLDGYYHSIVNLRLLPEEAMTGMMKYFEEFLPDESEFMLTIQKPDQEKEASRMRIKANLSKANAFFRIMEDSFAQERARQFEAFMNEMAEKGESIFEISLSILVRAKSYEELYQKRETVLKAFPKLGGAVGVSDHFEHDLLFLSHLPMQGDENPLRFPVLTEALTRILPICEEWKGTDKPGILLKTYRDEGLKLDLFDPELPAKHALMIGSTGSGKSFTTNYLLSQFLIENPRNHVVILDMGGSYRKLARIFKGSYLEIDCSEEYAINLFPVKEKFDSYFLSFLTTLLEKMVTEDKKLNQNDLRILEKAVKKVYEPLSPESSPLLKDVEAILRDFSLGDDEDKKRAYHFSKNLSIWTEGRFGTILNRPGKLSLDNRLIVFDLGKLSQHPEFQSILFFVIRSSLSKKLHDTSLRKMIVIDEGWRFFNDEVGSRLIEELYRTARKSNGLVLSISQSPEDFLESQASTAILANSYVKYILRLQKSHELLSKLDLGENEIRAVRELEIRPGVFSEIFIKFSSHGVIAKLEPSGLDYWISTTDPEDFLEEEKLRREFPEKNDLEILEELAFKFPNGVGKAGKKTRNATDAL